MKQDGTKYLAVIGAGICDTETAAAAEEIGHLIARAGAAAGVGRLNRPRVQR